MQHAIIGIPCDIKVIGLLPYHAVGAKYIAAAVGGAGGQALLIPSLGDVDALQGVLDLIDGILLTGSPSNIEPHHYGGETSQAGSLHDPARDATTLALIPRVVAQGIPLLGICRGCQEINVAFGGELFQQVHEQPGLHDHREHRSALIAEQYALSHAVHFPEGGLLRQLTGQAGAQVNSLHGQGVKRLADGLTVEAVADDGLIEAFSVKGAKSFALALQWHPEWQYAENPLSQAILQAFGAACRWRRAQRSG